MKLCIITCHNQPDYIRAVTLRAAAERVQDVDVVILKNKQTGILRYLEVAVRLMKVRLRENPNAYLLTFRGYEMLLPVRLLTLGKILIYDEFINPIEWVVKEQRSVEAKPGTGKLYATLIRLASQFITRVVASTLFKRAYRLLVNSVDKVLTDTSSHADISAELTRVMRSKFFAIPVGTDEQTFTARSAKTVNSNDKFSVLYYGNMLPLHGLSHTLKAAVQLKDKPVTFVFVGGDKKVEQDIAQAQSDGASIRYIPWVDYAKLPELMQSADLCLAGPFGDTFQSQFVITGKAYQFLSMGRPTVVGENKESGVFEDKETALVVKQGSSEALVEAIVWSLEHRAELEQIGKNGRQLYQENYSSGVLAHFMEELLLGLSSR